MKPCNDSALHFVFCLERQVFIAEESSTHVYRLVHKGKKPCAH